MRSLWIAGLTLWVSFWLMGVGHAATYHVATNGDDGRTCATAQNVSTPRLTPRGGMNCLSAGDTLLIAPGTYGGSTTQHFIPPNKSGTDWNNPITVRGSSSSNRPVLRVHLATEHSAQDVPANSHYWVFQDLIVDASHNYPIGYNAINVGDGIKLVNVWGKDATHSSITSWMASSPRGRFFINVEGSGASTASNGACTNNSPNWEGENICHGLYISGPNITVDGGSFHHNMGAGIHPYSLEHGVTSIIIKNAKFWNNNAQGIHLSTGFGTHQIFNNTFSGEDTAIAIPSAASVNAYNNTFYGSGKAFFCPGTNLTARNNIYHSLGDIYEACGPEQSNNLCWPGSIGAGCAIVGDPRFVSEVGGDFKISEVGSPAVAAAPRISTVLTDHEGATRSDPTTIGAFEFEPVDPPQLPPVGLVGEWLFEANANSTAAVPDSNPVRFHHGTLVGDATITTPGLVGAGRLTLDGDGDYVQIPGHADLAPATQFVIFARIKPASLPGRQEIYNAGDSIGFFQEGGVLSCFYYRGNNQWTEAKMTTPVVGLTVQHVACGKRQGHATLPDGLILYHEGAQVHFMATTGTINYTLGTDAFIGRHGTSNDSFFNGDIDSVRFYANQRPTQMGVTNDFNELIPQIGLSVRDMAFTKADALEGEVLGINQDRTHRLGSAIGLRFSITKGSE